MEDCLTLYYTRLVRFSALSSSMLLILHITTIERRRHEVDRFRTSVVLQKTAHAPTSLIVLHDSIEHEPTALSLKFGGSANGHNGIRSLIAALVPKTFFVYAWILGNRNPTSRITSSLDFPTLGASLGHPMTHGPGLELVWEQIQRIALQVEQGSPKH
jgi:hypothetical protein